ncbi:3-dehydroquinate synthase [Salinibacter ruber M8]|uniref:3-dehydroquinate synthase n=1 Tax=Salinibacter ruber (strain M8) TaxID=761659 RepID=D5H9E1_SALRM|nr:3-dehydroquinate synthase [Salinibacter ruber M8]
MPSPLAPMAVFVDLDERSYTVHFDSLATVPSLLEDVGLAAGRCLLVTDENVAHHYETPLIEGLSNAGWTVRSLVLPPGEQTKSASCLHRIYDDALAWGIDRQTPVLALGGGVVGDLAGFAAATLLRGLPLVQLPTSLLAQVDASVGGKTAINHDTGKNLIGAFYQPELVCADPQTLDTLPMREYTSGMAEVIKHALIRDPDLFEALEDHLVPVMARKDREIVSSVIEDAVGVKADVVSADEREEGRRAILNFGHTFAHALERVAGYGAFTHGEAVAIGMRAGLYLSHQRHPEAVPRERLDHVIRAVPIESDPAEVPFPDLYAAMAADKKNEGGTIRFVLLEQLGQAYVTGDVTEADARHAWQFACSN